MRTERIEKRSTVLFAVVVLCTVTLTLASQHASAAATAVRHKVTVHHKADTVSRQASGVVVVHHKVTVHHKAHTVSKVHHKEIAVIPEMHGEATTAAVHKKAKLVL
jgi:hypothetical protein